MNGPNNWTAVPGVYALNPSSKPSDRADHLQARLSQLQAMLAMMQGDGREAFDSLSDDLRDNYVWACSMAVSECKAMIGSIELSANAIDKRAA